MDEAYTAAILEATTEDFFVTPHVDHLPRPRKRSRRHWSSEFRSEHDEEPTGPLSPERRDNSRIVMEYESDVNKLLISGGRTVDPWCAIPID